MKKFNEELLTRYVLGEASAEEVALINADLVGNAEMQKQVKELRGFTAAFSKELKKESFPSLSAKEHGELEKMMKPKKSRWNTGWMLAPMGLAFGFTAVVLFNKVQKQDADRLSQAPEVKAAEKQNKIQSEIFVAADSPVSPVENEMIMADESDMSMADLAAVAPPASSPALLSAPVSIMARQSKMSVGGLAKGKSSSLSEGANFKKEATRDRLQGADKDFNTESYAQIVENNFKKVGDEPYSTFSIDVDTAGYSVMRRFINQGSLPPAESVRIEELMNYFPYDYKGPQGADPFAVNVELTKTPWNLDHKLLRVGIKAKDIDWKKRPNSNLVFLMDVSGSMGDPNKLPLVKTALKMLIENLGENDKVAIVVYAGASGLALPATRASDRSQILAALENLQAGGSTNGGDGIRLAYKIAQENFIKGGINRVMLATDGDFNVGTTSEAELVSLIEEKAKSKVFLTVMGFGMGNYKDANLEKLANKGNGSYAYIDNVAEARKILVEQAGGTLMTIAKDVKIQIEFNPTKVAGYRLIGYENRLLNKEDFNDDTKDAGEIGAGHTVTALYEIVPAGKTVPGASVDPLRYQKPTQATGAADSKELLNLKLRYKKPEGDVSQLITVPVLDADKNFAEASSDLKFQAGVAEFGMILRDSKFKGTANFDSVIEKIGANQNRAGKADSYRVEFLDLIRKARSLK